MLSIDTRATLKHLNARKEGQGEPDEKILALDIKLADGEVGADVLAHLLGSDRKEVERSLWAEDKDQNRKFFGVDHLACGLCVEHLDVRIAGVKLHDCRARKFLIVPVAGCRATLSWQISVTGPDEDALPILAEYLGEEVPVTVSQAQGDLFGQPLPALPLPGTPRYIDLSGGPLDALVAILYPFGPYGLPWGGGPLDAPNDDRFSWHEAPPPKRRRQPRRLRAVA